MQKGTKPQSEFDERVTAWKNMDRNSPDAKKAAFAFYDEHIFPFVKKVFLSKPKNRSEKQYDALILTVGLSPEPLILSILAMKPKRVGLLYTPETEKYLPRIQKETELTLDRLDTRQIDGSNVVEMYKAIMALYTSWDSPTNIAVDITGGKKSMVSGAAMAGAVLGADIYYVDTDKFDRELSKPEPGTEYLSLLENPYTVFGDLEVERAKSLYKGHDYAGAQRTFEQLKKQVGDGNKAKTYEAYEYLCTVYEAWDNLEVGKAKTFLDRLSEILKQFSALDGLRHLSDFQSCLEKQKEALNALQKFVKKSELALQSPDGFHFAFTLYHNALRRENQGKLDMACLLLYRLLEWIEQHRLDQYGINTREADYSKSSMAHDELLKQYNQKRRAVYGGGNTSALPNRITLVDGFLILDILEDAVVENLNWGNFRSQVETRNQSIYAHGMSKINLKNFKAFKSTVEERFKKVQEIANIDADAFNEQHKFIAPLP